MLVVLTVRRAHCMLLPRESYWVCAACAIKVRKKDRKKTDRWKPDCYIMLTARRSQHNNNRIEGNTHKSATTHNINVFVSQDLDLWLSDTIINGFPGIMAGHFSVKFGDPSCMGFWYRVEKRTDRQTDRQNRLVLYVPFSVLKGYLTCK